MNAGRITRDRAMLLHYHEVWSRISAQLGLDYRQETW